MGHTQIQHPINQGNTTNAAGAQQKGKHNVPDFNIRKCSISYIVIVLMQLGMNPLQRQISDLANVQDASSGSQNDVTNMGSFMSNIESQVEGYNSGKTTGKGGGLPSDFWNKNNAGKLAQFAKQFGKYFDGNPANGKMSDFVLYFPGINWHSKTGLALDKKLTGELLPKFWAEMKKATGGAGSFIKNSGNISDIQMYMLQQVQRNLDAKYLGNTNPKVYANLDLKSKVFDPMGDPMVATGALVLWKEFNSPLAAQSGGNNTPGFTNFAADIQAYINPKGTHDLGKLESDVNTMAREYYDNNNPGSTSTSTTPTNTSPSDSFMKTLYQDTSTAQSLAGTQSQKDTQDVSKENSELTSDDKVGQTIVSNIAQMMTQVIQSYKSS
ncbi:MAG: hypothetical protein KAR79_00535 [Simkaniaceae bacterium]|nr:hypothetical protein [Simkaniaceae bacterium]